MILIHLPTAPPLFPPPGVHYLANYLLANGESVEILDINIELCHSQPEMWNKFDQFSHYEQADPLFRDFVQKYASGITQWLQSKNETFVGVSRHDNNHDFFTWLARFLKEAMPTLTIIAGGPDVYERLSRYKGYLSEGMLDYLILKEGEKKILALLRNQSPLPGGIISRDSLGEGLIQYQDESQLDLQSESVPLTYLVHYPALYQRFRMLPVFASRGCVSSCRFCSHKLLWDQYRSKTPEQMAAELQEYIVKGTHVFYFVDMLINGSRTWLKEFVELVLALSENIYWSSYARVDGLFSDRAFVRAMVQAGCRFLSFGVESHSQAVLNAAGKGTTVEDNIQTIQNTSQEGLFLHVSFIVGLPYETLADLAQTMTFIYEQIWNMDHIEIFFFKNYEQSVGYEWSQDYLENHSHKDHYAYKRELHARYLSEFNRIGSHFLDVKYLFHPKGYVFKQVILEYYSLRLAEKNETDFWKEQTALHPVISEMSDFCNLAKRADASFVGIGGV
ncbi:MAG: radical SAM protein, partial [Candidatus Margulisiibacteriota bacterium]